MNGLIFEVALSPADVASLDTFISKDREDTKRKLLLDLWDALPAHEENGDCAGSLRATLLFSEAGDEIRNTRLAYGGPAERGS